MDCVINLIDEGFLVDILYFDRVPHNRVPHNRLILKLNCLDVIKNF